MVGETFWEKRRAWKFFHKNSGIMTLARVGASSPLRAFVIRKPPGRDALWHRDWVAWFKNPIKQFVAKGMHPCIAMRWCIGDRSLGMVGERPSRSDSVYLGHVGEADQGFFWGGRWRAVGAAVARPLVTHLPPFFLTRVLMTETPRGAAWPETCGFGGQRGAARAFGCFRRCSA